MNAHDRRKHERMLVALLTRKRSSGLRRMSWKRVHALRMLCFKSAWHTLPPLPEDELLAYSQQDALRTLEGAGDLSKHIVRVQPAFAKRYPRAAVVLPDFYRRTFKQNVKMLRFGTQYHASLQTIAKILSGEAEDQGLLVATSPDKGLRHLAKMQNFYDSPHVRQTLAADAALRAVDALRRVDGPHGGGSRDLLGLNHMIHDSIVAIVPDDVPPAFDLTVPAPVGVVPLTTEIAVNKKWGDL